MSEGSTNEIRLSLEELEILRHTLGVSAGRKRVDRNHYCAADGDPKLERLVEVGVMKRAHTINDGRDRYYQATDLGMRWAGVDLAAEQRRIAKKARERKRLERQERIDGLNGR